MPGLSVFVNFFLTDVTMRARHSLVLPLPGALYGYVNYLETKSRGYPLYWFLTWTDLSSIAIVAGMTALFMLIFVGLSLGTVQIKRSSNKHDHSKKV